MRHAHEKSVFISGFHFSPRLQFRPRLLEATNSETCKTSILSYITNFYLKVGTFFYADSINLLLIHT